MISLCTVLIDEMLPCLEFFLGTIRRLSLVNEVLIAHVNGEDREWQDNGVFYRQFAHHSPPRISHTTGLHEAIRRANNDLLLLSDPDILFYSDVAGFYLGVMEGYNLNIVGISHHNALNQCYTFFPTVVNCLVRRKDLPPPGWLEGLIRDRPYINPASMRTATDHGPAVDGLYLVPGPIPERYNEFPNHRDEAIYDVGSNLWLWAQDAGWKWQSFQTTDCHRYTSRLHRGNIKVPPQPKRDLLYHVVGASNQRPDDLACFQAEYERTLHD